MIGSPNLMDISTRRERIAELARYRPALALKTLAHHMDLLWLKEAWRLTRKDGAPGVDGVTAEEYQANLDGNLEALLNRAKSGMYRAPPVRRVHIPKGSGGTRPLGIPTLEDKVLQRAVVMILECVYEQDFLECSYGFRPGRSAHRVLDAMETGLMSMGGGFVLELDIKSYFDSISHAELRKILDQRVQDGVLRRLIGKWLNAGVMEEGRVEHPSAGTPQGGVVSPLLSNIFLHEVLDVWFAQEVQPRMKGRCFMVRYADDAALCFALEEDARRVLEVLPKRFEKYGLQLHPEKTRLVRFKPDRKEDDPPPGRFDLLGFTHGWEKNRRGAWVIMKRTAKGRLSRALHSINECCRAIQHYPLAEQREILAQKVRGHYGYFGVPGNGPALDRFFQAAQRFWKKWLGRRSQRAYLNWAHFKRLLAIFPLPRPPNLYRALHAAANP